MKKPTAIVSSAKKRIRELYNEFDAIVVELETTAMTKTEYNAIEQELRDTVYSMKDVTEQL